MNVLGTIVAVLQAGAAVEAACKSNWKMAAVFALFAASSAILATVKQ